MSDPISGPIADILPDPPRLDREDTYIGVLVSLWFAGLGIFLLPILSGTVAVLDEGTQKLLGLLMILGTSLSLLGSIMGPGMLKITAPIRWVVWKVQKHYTSMALRHCYRLGAAGLWGNCFALLFFTEVLLTHGSVVGSFTGLMSPALLVAWIRKGRRMFKEARRMDRDYKRLRNKVVGR